MLESLVLGGEAVCEQRLRKHIKVFPVNPEEQGSTLSEESILLFTLPTPQE